jgi:hypothetical protein
MSDICLRLYTLTLAIICSIYTTPRRTEEPATAAPARPLQAIHPHALQAAMPSVDPLNTYPFQVYAPPPPPPIHGAPPRGMTNAPPQPWQVTIAPAQTHLHPPPPPHPHMMHRPPAGPSQPGTSQHYREDTWDGYNTPDEMAAQPTAYEFRYRDEQSGWVAGPGPYYEPSVRKSYLQALYCYLTLRSQYEQSYGQPPYMEETHDHSSASNSVTGPQPPHIPVPVPGPSVPPPSGDAEKTRGRKRTRIQVSFMCYHCVHALICWFFPL